MTDKSNTEMLLPQAGIPGYIPQPKKNASEDVIGEYKKQVQQLGDKGLKEDKTGLSAKLTVHCCTGHGLFPNVHRVLVAVGLFICQSLPLGFCPCTDLSQSSHP